MQNMTKILVLCTGNSARSQMAEAFLRSFDNKLEVYSAGVNPAEKVSRFAIKVMQEKNIDISGAKPKDVSIFLNESFDYVITVCDHAKETCPVFSGKVMKRLHLGFEDPDGSVGTDEERTAFFRNIRDQIEERFREFWMGVK